MSHLEVAVNDALVVQVLDGPEQGPHEVSGFLFVVEGLRHDAVKQLAAFQVNKNITPQSLNHIQKCYETTHTSTYHRTYRGTLHAHLDVLKILGVLRTILLSITSTACTKSLRRKRSYSKICQHQLSTAEDRVRLNAQR